MMRQKSSVSFSVSAIGLWAVALFFPMAMAFLPHSASYPPMLRYRGCQANRASGWHGNACCVREHAASRSNVAALRASMPRDTPNPGGAPLQLLRLGDLSSMLGARAASCGAVSKMTLGTRSVFFIAAPGLVKEVCVDKAAIFPDREKLADEDIAAGCPAPLGLTLGQYDAWNASRSILAPSFFRRDELADHARLLVDMTLQMGAHWEERTQTRKT